ncbi:MAG: amidohydrolase family protein [Phycisphaerae bacterium]|nr:amidohydrolase family protein [Phycisphaerae bacterium]
MRCVLTYSLLIMLMAVGPVAADDVLAIKADRVETVASGVIQNGIVVVRNGRITAVGADVDIPDDATIMDVNDKTVFPGLINPFSHLGLSSGGGGGSYFVSGGRRFVRSSGGSSGSNPHYRVVDELYAHQEVYTRALQAGFTTLALSPTAGTIAGQGAVVRPCGDRSEDMVILESGLLMSYFSAGQAQAQLRSALESGKKNPTSTDPRIEPLSRVVKGEMPLFIRSSTPADTLHLLKVLKDFDKVKPTLICGPQTVLVAEQLARQKIPVILPAAIDNEPDTYNQMNVAYTLAKAGVKIACHPVSDTVLGHEDFFRQMAQLVKSGLDRDTAKRAMTLHPAEMLGLDYRIGSIEKGKDANLLILSGDPLATDTRILRVIIEGKTVYTP